MIFQLEQQLSLRPVHLRHRNPRLQRNRHREVIFRQLRLLVRPLLLHFLELLFHLLRLRLTQCCCLKIFLFCHLRHLIFRVFEPHFQLLILRAAPLVRLHLRNRCRLVNHINHLIRHKPIINIPPRHINRCLQHRIRNLHPVMLLIMPFHPLQNLQRHLRTRFFHHHRLEPPRQRLIFLDVLPIFIQRRRPNQLQLSPRQRRLQNVRRIH